MMFWLLRVWNAAVPSRFQMGEESWQHSAFLTEGFFSVSLGVFLTTAWAAVTGDDGHLPNLLAGSVLGVFVGGHFVDLLTGDRSRAPPNIISAFLIAGLSASPLLWGASPAVVVPLFFAVHHAVNRLLRWPRLRQGFLSIDKKAMRAVFVFIGMVFSPLIKKGSLTQGFKRIIVGSIFFFSLGLIHDNRAESEGPFVPENGVDGLVSFSSNPDAEKEAARLRRELDIHLLALQTDGDPNDAIKNIVATLQEAVYEQNPGLTRELALSVQASSSAGPWLKSLAELMVLRERSKEKTFGQGEGPAILNDLEKIQAAVFNDPKWFYGPGKVISDDKVLSMMIDVYSGIRHEPLSLEARTGELIQLYNLLHDLSQKEKVSSVVALLTGNIHQHFLSVEDARALLSSPEMPEWLKSIAAEVIERSESEEGVTAEKQTDGIVSVFLRNKGLKSEKDLWPLVLDWARDVLLGTAGSRQGRVMNLSPLEAYVLLEVMSRQDPTIPMDPVTTAQVRAQLMVKIISELDQEKKRGPSPEDAGVYGPILHLILYDAEGFGRQAFLDQVVRSGQMEAISRLFPDSLRGLLSERIRESRPLISSSSPTGLLPLIGRPVVYGLARLGLNHRLAAGIAGFAEQGLLLGGVVGVAGWIGFGSGWTLVWLVIAAPFLWMRFPTSHGRKGLFFENEWMDEGWVLKESYLWDKDFRALRWASHWFFGPFLVISLVPYLFPFLGIPVPGSPESWMVGGALLSSFFHGFYNSFFPSYGKVAAVGGGVAVAVPVGSAETSGNLEAAKVEFLSALVGLPSEEGTLKEKDLAPLLEKILPRPGSLEVESLDARAIRALRRVGEAVRDSARVGPMKKALEVKVREGSLSRPDVASVLRVFGSLGSGSQPTAGMARSVPVFLSVISSSNLPSLDRLIKSHRAAFALAQVLGVPTPPLLLTAADARAQRVLAEFKEWPAGVGVLAPSFEGSDLSAQRLDEGFRTWRTHSAWANTPLSVVVGLPAGFIVKGLESLAADSPIKTALENILRLLADLRPTTVDFSNWFEMAVLVSKQA